jgi:hypothetical protein
VRWHAFKWRTTAEPESVKLRKSQTTNGTGDVPKSVAASVAVCGSIGSFPNAETVEHDDSGTTHQGFGIVCTK